MKKNKVYAGYICLKPINGIIFPSYAQNQINKKYIVEELNGDFFIATNENMYADNQIVLNSLIKEKNKLSGIVMLSAFSLPENYKARYKIYLDSIKNKKKLYFIFEKFLLKSKKDIEKIENYLIYRENFFTKIKKNLNTFEKKNFLNKAWEYI